MKCAKCDRELEPDPNSPYSYIEPFVAPKIWCAEHGYQMLVPTIAFKPTKSGKLRGSD